jgi:hypothetical protein
MSSKKDMLTITVEKARDGWAKLTIDLGKGGEKLSNMLPGDHPALQAAMSAVDAALLVDVPKDWQLEAAMRDREGRGNATETWAKEIHGYAAQLGYDWDDKSVRDEVRQWAIDNGHTVYRTGVIRKDVLDAHHKATKVK